MTREEAIEYINTLYMALAVFPNQQISLGNIDKMKESVSMAIEALKQIPDNATNGDVIKALFPNEKWERCPENRYNRASMQSDNMGINMELWNAPYKSESDKSADTFEKLLNSGFYEGIRKER